MQKLFKLLFYSIKATFSKNKVIRLQNKLKAHYIMASKMLDFVEIDDSHNNEDRCVTIDFCGTYEDMSVELLFAIDSIISNQIYIHGSSTHTPIFVYKKMKVHVDIELQGMQVSKDKYRGQIIISFGIGDTYASN